MNEPTPGSGQRSDGGGYDEFVHQRKQVSLESAENGESKAKITITQAQITTLYKLI